MTAAKLEVRRMPLQNRVDPLGAIHAVDSRGLFTGNRGVIHDPATRALSRRRWTSKAWIVCTLAYKDRPPRDVLGRNAPGGGAGWTELFFLDEVTALAAGHRPCFFCRREAARDFAGCFGEGAGVGTRALNRMSAPQMDRALHSERIASGGTPRPLTKHDIPTLPDGAMVLVGSAPHAVRRHQLLPWSFAGYDAPASPDPAAPLVLLTPPSIVATLAAGYAPVWHPTALP